MRLRCLKQILALRAGVMTDSHDLVRLVLPADHDTSEADSQPLKDIVKIRVLGSPPQPDLEYFDPPRIARGGGSSCLF